MRLHIYTRQKALEIHKKKQGKVGIYAKIAVRNLEDLSLAYVPGGAEPAIEIMKDKLLVNTYTGRGNRVAVISNGTAVWGLGDIGPYAAMPVIEGKCLLLKVFADIDGFPICVNTKDPDKIIEFAQLLEPSFGGINIEDIASPDTFKIVELLDKQLDIPVFCDDQYGTAVVVYGALINALKVVGKKLEEVKICIVGAGAAGIATARLLLDAGAKNVVVVNKSGILNESNPHMNEPQKELSLKTNPEGLKGDISVAVEGADVLIGLSVGGIIKQEHIRKMTSYPIVFALALPEPEITAEEAIKAGAYIVATGRGDCKNQISNLFGFPGIFRGALDVEAKEINKQMLFAASYAIANIVEERKLSPQHIVPDPFHEEIVPRVAEAVAQAAIRTNVAQKILKPGVVYHSTWNRLYGDIMTRL